MSATSMLSADGAKAFAGQVAVTTAGQVEFLLQSDKPAQADTMSGIGQGGPSAGLSA